MQTPISPPHREFVDLETEFGCRQSRVLSKQCLGQIMLNLLGSRYQQQRDAKAQFLKALDIKHRNPSAPLDKQHLNKNVSEWATASLNILDKNVDCPNKCSYCYNKAMQYRFDRLPSEKSVDSPFNHNDYLGRLDDVAEHLQVLPPKRKCEIEVILRRPPQTIMFPTTHNIFVNIVKSTAKSAMICFKLAMKWSL